MTLFLLTLLIRVYLYYHNHAYFHPMARLIHLAIHIYYNEALPYHHSLSNVGI